MTTKRQMLALTSDFYDNYEGQNYFLNFREPWVTVPSGLHQFFQSQADAPSMRRLEQV
ncbi:hypothetical protein DFAR_1690005 [Desulfarculales bacterium]